MNPRLFIFIVFVLFGAAIVRSSISTRLDSFTQDEAYHLAAGVSYVKFGDFRINPEHPPLVKLWIGTVLNRSGFQIGPLRRFNDKVDERDFTEQAVFLQNDADFVQRRARMGMWMLNGVLLLCLILATKRTFGVVVALGTLLFLVIDPTVAAHLPVVMTDLPMAMAAGTGIVFAARVFRDWLWGDVVASSAFLGFALATKHSAPVALVGVALAGSGILLLQAKARVDASRKLRFIKLAVMLIGSVAVLWLFYGFRYAEGHTDQEQFNRPLLAKILDVDSPSYRRVLGAMDKSHIVPRAYLWGFADTVHAGMEGRMITELAFGNAYDRKAPWYFFPCVIAVKLPIGLGLLSVLGIILFGWSRLPVEWNSACAVLLLTLIVFLVVMSRGATYGGIRHAMPVVILLSVFGGIAAASAIFGRSRILMVGVAIAYLGAGFSALPVLRPWEYFNEIVGGSQNAYKYFSDEGVDCGQRIKELANYYSKFVKGSGGKPDLLYVYSQSEMKARGIDFLGRDMDRDFAEAAKPQRNGFIFVSPAFLFHKSYWDRAALRNAKPVARFGNLFVYSGMFDLPGDAALTLYYRGNAKLFTEHPDWDAAESAFRQAAQLDPTAYFVNIDLGNVCLLRGKREESLEAYRLALDNVRDDLVMQGYLKEQIRRVSVEDLRNIPPVRDPTQE
jgi:hypothetical protein